MRHVNRQKMSQVSGRNQIMWTPQQNHRPWAPDKGRFQPKYPNHFLKRKTDLVSLLAVSCFSVYLQAHVWIKRFLIFNGKNSGFLQVFSINPSIDSGIETCRTWSSLSGPRMAVIGYRKTSSRQRSQRKWHCFQWSLGCICLVSILDWETEWKRCHNTIIYHNIIVPQ